MTTEQELQNEISGMWDDMRKEGCMVIDAPARKIGMPHAEPYDGACFPVEIDGHLSFVSIPAEQIERFANALLAAAALSLLMEREHGSEMAAHEAISKAKGQ